MPMADSRPPMVVGIRQTSSATSTMIDCWAARVDGERLQRWRTASRKMMVRPASRMSRAISLGVFWRLAPSTRAIMRSRKVSPGLEVIRTTMPVGEHPGAAGDRRAVAAGLPDHRGGLAGDGRLVHGGDPLDDVAVARDELPGLHHAQVAELELARRHLHHVVAPLDVGDGLRPGLRRVSAWALPRPSATASAKLANSTVNHSHTTN